MTDITRLPMVRVPKEWLDKFERQVWTECIADGRAAYRAGLPENHATGRFRDNDMAVSWQMGYHQARAEDAKVKK